MSLASEERFPLEKIISAFKQTHHPEPEALKQAEEFLKQASENEGFCPKLLRLLSTTRESSTDGVNSAVRQSVSIYLKNTVKKFWHLEERVISDDDRKVLKERIVQVMLSSDRPVQTQLCEAISLIAKVDFYRHWGSLLPELCRHVSTSRFDHNRGVLEIVRSITDKYVGKEKTAALVSEVRYILNEFGNLFLKAISEWSQQICKVFRSDSPTAAGSKILGLSDEDKSQIKQMVECMGLVASIFGNLMNLDYIANFDRDKSWVPAFVNLLQCRDYGVTSDGRTVRVFESMSESTPFESMLASICAAVRVVAFLHDDDIQEDVPRFVQIVCGMVSDLDGSERYDQLVSEAMQFLTVVSRQAWHLTLFKDEERLSKIVDHLIIRNLTIRPSDLNMYEMEGSDWVSRDMEGSDRFTRRRSALDFLDSLTQYLETPVCNLVLKRIEALSRKFEENRAKNFVAMNTAINLMLAIGIRSKTADYGVTAERDCVKSSSMPCLKFFGTKLLPILVNRTTLISEKKEPETGSEGDSQIHVLLASDSLKFVVLFRSQLQAEKFSQVIQLSCRCLQSKDYVLHTYAAMALDKLLALREINTKELAPEDVAVGIVGTLKKGPYKLQKSKMKDKLPNMLIPLFHLVLHNEESSHNDHVMRCILRVVQRAEESIIGCVTELLKSLTLIIQRLSKNPGKQPSFYHYLFEIMAAVVFFICSTDPSKCVNFEGALFETFDRILTLDTCTEFHPYVYQLIAALLKLKPALDRSDATIAQILDFEAYYLTKFDKLLHPSLWQETGTIQAVSALFDVFLCRITQLYQKPELLKAFLTKKRVEGMLGIYQTLLGRRVYDREAFTVLRTVLSHVPIQTGLLNPYYRNVFDLIFKRLGKQKTDVLCMELMKCLSVIFINARHSRVAGPASENGFDSFWESVWTKACGFDAGLFSRICLIWLEKCTLVKSAKDRRLITLAMIEMICSRQFISAPELGQKHWTGMVQKSVEMMEARAGGSAKSLSGSHSSAKAVESRLKVMESQGFSSAFVGLAYARVDPFDVAVQFDWPDLVRKLFAMELGRAMEKDARLAEAAAQGLGSKHSAMCNAYFKQFSVPFAFR